MKSIIKQKKAFFSIMIAGLLAVYNPLFSNTEQGVVFAVFSLGIFLWVTEWIPQWVVSIGILVAFLLSGASPNLVFSFPQSKIFLLIVAAYLLTAGIRRAGIADYISFVMVQKFCKRTVDYIAMAFVLGIVLIFLIPQPFPRVLIIGEIYRTALAQTSLLKQQKEIIFYSVFIAGTVTSLLFLNGDILANHVAFEMAGIPIDSFMWMKYMTIPTIGATITVFLVFCLTFKSSIDFQRVGLPLFQTGERSATFNRTLYIMAFVIVMWMLEPIHSIPPAYVAASGVIIMLITKSIHLEEIKAVNGKLLLFLTAQFAIGRVLLDVGIIDTFKQWLLRFLPDANATYYIFALAIIVMSLHMMLGSIITVMTVIIPTLLSLTSGILHPETLVLVVCVTTYFHIFMPYHQITTLVGYQEGYYTQRIMLRLGISLTVATLLSLFLFYLPWWSICGII